MSRGYKNLTRSGVQRLGRGGKATEGGITAQRLPDGDVRWSVNIMVSRRRVHRVIGRQSEGVARSHCEAFIESARTDERNDRLSLPKNRKTQLSFEQVARRYLERSKAGGARNLRHKEPQVEKKLIPYFGHHPMAAITEFAVNGYKKQRLQSGAASGTINRELATLKHLFRDAVKARDIQVVPATFKLLAEPAGRMRVLSEVEIDDLLKAAVADEDPDLGLFVAFGLNTAMRHSEILQARFDQVDWDRRRLHVPRAKAGSREQPLTIALVDALKTERERRADKEGFIFQAISEARTKTGHRLSMRKPFQRAARNAGLNPKEVTPHVMRHTAITRLVEAGADIPTIQKISGHKSVSMVLRYTHVSSPHVDAAIAALDRATPAPVGGENDSDDRQDTQDLHTPSEAEAA